VLNYRASWWVLCKHRNEHSGSINGVAFLDQRSRPHILMNLTLPLFRLKLGSLGSEDITTIESWYARDEVPTHASVHIPRTGKKFSRP
jgi:hypothetical protein